MICVIDIGGTQIKYGVIDEEEVTLVFKNSIPTLAKGAEFNMLDRLSIILDEVMQQFSISGVAISTAGAVDPVNGEIIYANDNIPNYRGTKLKDAIEKKYQLTCSVENDVNSALLGEIYFGYHQKYDSAILFTIGTGVGGAIALNGQIYHGFTSMAGEVGYSIIDGENIEQNASTTALVNRVKARLQNDNIDGFWIFDQATNHHNAVCIEEINRMLEYLVLLINNAVSLLNPEVVILGGGIMEQENYLRPIIQQKFDKINTNQLVREATKIRFATLGNKAGMMGAYKHFLQQNS